MKKGRFTEEQIIGILQEQEAGLKTAEVCRKHGISQPTFYAWKAKYGGLSVPDAKRLKQLEDENAKLKKLLAEAMLDRGGRVGLNSVSVPIDGFPANYLHQLPWWGIA